VPVTVSITVTGGRMHEERCTGNAEEFEHLDKRASLKLSGDTGDGPQGQKSAAIFYITNSWALFARVSQKCENFRQ
jgi:hypothetical protein